MTINKSEQFLRCTGNALDNRLLLTIVLMLNFDYAVSTVI